MKKNLLIVAMAALAMAGCSKNEVLENQTSNNMINFKPYVGTKGVDANNDLIQGANVGFNVYAWYNSGDATASGNITASFKADFMDAVNVKFSTDWSYENPKYWPVIGTLDFIAIGNNVTPAAGENPLTGEYKFKTSSGEGVNPTIEFTTSNNPADQKDLVADFSMVGKAKTDIAFKLKHLLSKIDVKVKNTSDLTLEVKSVKFTGIKSTGTYDIITNSWAPTVSDGEENTVKLKSPLIFINGQAVIIHDTNEGLIIIPQDATSIIIGYDFKDSDGRVIDSQTKTIDLTNDAKWAPNTHYTYTLAITPEASKVSFTAEVENWTITSPEKP